MNGSMKESIELTEEIISKNLNEWQKQAKPYYTKTDYEELLVVPD